MYRHVFCQIGPDDIRGFIEGGWDTLHNKEGDLSSRVRLSKQWPLIIPDSKNTLQGSQYQLSITYFEKYILPCLSNKDTIIFVTGDEQGVCVCVCVTELDSVHVCVFHAVLSDSERLLTELGATNCYTGLITTATKIVKVN